MFVLHAPGGLAQNDVDRVAAQKLTVEQRALLSLLHSRQTTGATRSE